jgi:PAS domain S-box-containing protein
VPRLESLKTLFAPDGSLPLQVRLFRVVCVTTAFVCLVVVLPMNLLQNLPVLVNVADVATGLIALYCYRASLQGRNHTVGFFVVVVLLLNPVWFLNAGSDGSISYYFLPLVLYPAALFRGRLRWTLTVLLALNLCGLLVLEHFFPALSIPFPHPVDRLVDLTAGVIGSFTIIVALAWLLTATYDREQQRLAAVARELAASERNYREIFNATSDALFIHDEHGRVVDMNEPMCAMFRCDRAAALGATADDFSLGTSPYSHREAIDQVRRALAGEKPVFVWQSRRADGELFWSEVALRGAEIAGQKRVIASVRDITARVQAEEEWRINAERLRLALEASNQGWFDLDVVTGRGRASAEYARILGRPAVDYDITLQCWLDGLHPDDRAAATKALHECMTAGGPVTAEYRRRTDAGEWKWIRSVAKIVERDDAGKPRRMLGTHADITVRKDLEWRLQQSQRLEAVGTLAGGAAHDLNNIFTPLLLAGDILREKLPDPADRELIRQLETGANRGAAIVRNLLAFSRGLAADSQPLDPVVHIQKVTDRLRPTLPPAIVLRERLPADSWRVNADAVQLEQALHNLCLNAVEAMPQGGTLTLAVENHRKADGVSSGNPWGRTGPHVLITVSDTGRGIPATIIDRIFEPFFTTKDIGAGSGLGLSYVHGFVKSHRGFVAVESPPNCGATFKVFLPASENPTTGESTDTPAALGSKP